MCLRGVAFSGLDGPEDASSAAAAAVSELVVSFFSGLDVEGDLTTVFSAFEGFFEFFGAMMTE